MPRRATARRLRSALESAALTSKPPRPASALAATLPPQRRPRPSEAQYAAQSRAQSKTEAAAVPSRTNTQSKDVQSDRPPPGLSPAAAARPSARRRTSKRYRRQPTPPPNEDGEVPPSPPPIEDLYLLRE
jgi:hypothetical protein